MQKNITRAAITGVGVVCPIGIGMEAFDEALFTGTQELSDLLNMPTPRGKSRVSVVKDPSLTGPRRGFLMAQKTIAEAIANSNIKIAAEEEVGLVLSTINGDSRTLEDMYGEFMEADQVDEQLWQAMKLYPNGALLNALGDEFGLNGPRIVATNACASGNISLGIALDLIRSGRCQKVVVVGLEIIKLSMVWGAERAGFIGNQLRPFHKDRNGSVLGEGAGALIIEAEELLQTPRQLGWLDGFGCACDRGAAAITLLEDGSGLYRSMKLALEDGQRSPADLEYVNAHAPGTPLIDRVECDAVAQLSAEGGTEVFVNSTKSMTAHLSGASAIIEVIAIVQQMKRQFLHANLMLNAPDPKLSISPIGPENVMHKVKLGVSNACGGGGLNTSVLITAPEERLAASGEQSYQDNQELVITGLGTVSAVGLNVDDFNSNHLAIAKNASLDWFDIHQWYDPATKYKYFNRAAQLGAAAGAMSWENASNPKQHYDDDRIAVIAGTYLGGGPEASDVLCQRLQTNPRSILPSMSLDHGLHLGAALVSRSYDLTGLTYTLTGTITAGLQAIITACQVIRGNRADAVMAMAFDALDQPLQHAVSIMNGHARKTAIGEGAAAVFIERKNEIVQGKETVPATIKDAISISGSFKNPGAIRHLAERLSAHLNDLDWKVLYLAAVDDPRIDLLCNHLLKTLDKSIVIKRLQDYTNHCMAADGVLATIAAITRREHALILSVDLGGTVAALGIKNNY